MAGGQPPDHPASVCRHLLAAAVRVLLGCRFQADHSPLDFPGAPLRGALCFFTQ